MKHFRGWITEYERSGFRNSPGYEETIRYFRRFERYTPWAKVISFAVSPQGRTLHYLVASTGKEFTPELAKSSGKAVVLVQNGIHAGEIEGKDACMLLLRDILVSKTRLELLDSIILLVIPVLNVDGHERTSEYNRPNQNGPETMGWRTNSNNLNLNRDYLKADSPEVRGFLKLFNAWQPDLFIDNHTTNGADYQYHITYALEKGPNIDQSLGAWGQSTFLPEVLQGVERDGFLTAPYIQFKDDTIESGIIDTPALPRLSTGYAAVQNRLGLLVETHSLKPFRNRVESTYSMDLHALESVSKHVRTLKRLNAAADSKTRKLKTIPLKFELMESGKPFKFMGYKTDMEVSPITGVPVPRYSRIPQIIDTTLYDTVEARLSAKIPKEYYIPAEFQPLIAILELHGVTVRKLKTDVSRSVDQYRFHSVRFAQRPYEGRLCADVRCSAERRKVILPKGTYVVDTAQRTKRVIAHLLEPEGPDSFVSWGFINAFFERKEYAEAYIMEPIAREMMKRDPELRSAFEEAMASEDFRNDARARLEFFYTRSPYFDSREMRYPIFRSLV